jgi:tRNA-splicing ligase RtcB (3'-phosphate/5'-hydroxy nucleic acid ligase)
VAKGIEIRCESLRGIPEKAPEAYKDVSAVIEATRGRNSLARKTAKLSPLV